MKKELENLSESDEKVREMLASLKRVEAPKDFEFRLKARIAKANPKAFRTGYKRRLAFALPAFASIAVSAFVVINGNFFGGAEQVSSVNPAAAVAQTPFVQPQNAPNTFIATNTIAGKQPAEIFNADSNAQKRKDEKVEPSLTAGKFSEKRKNEVRSEAPKENSSGSTDIAGAETVVHNPKGLNPNTKFKPPKDLNSEKPFSVKELLSPLGVEVVAENGKWKVKTVSQNSAAERSGLKADDIIETLDGKKLSGSSVPGRKIEVKKLGVKRGDAQVEINLQTSPK